MEKQRRQHLNKGFKSLNILSEEVNSKEAYVLDSVTQSKKFTANFDIDIPFGGMDRNKLFLSVSFPGNLIKKKVNAVSIENVRFKEKIERRREIEEELNVFLAEINAK